LDLRIVRGKVSSTTCGGDLSPFCKFINVQLEGLQPSTGASGNRGTILLENPKGNFALKNEEFKRQVSVVCLYKFSWFLSKIKFDRSWYFKFRWWNDKRW